VEDQLLPNLIQRQHQRKQCECASIFVTAYNFCKVHGTLGCTPAVGLKLATETWTIEKLIEAALATN
jgi:cyanate permease